MSFGVLFLIVIQVFVSPLNICMADVLCDINATTHFVASTESIG